MGRLRQALRTKARNNYSKSLPQRGKSIRDGLCRESSLREKRDAENAPNLDSELWKRKRTNTLYTGSRNKSDYDRAKPIAQISPRMLGRRTETRRPVIRPKCPEATGVKRWFTAHCRALPCFAVCSYQE
jgi:hypothetical protein